MITRYAPTPSGFLHAGNLVNIALTAELAQRKDATIVLRIDDADTHRVRRAYIDDVFAALHWLDVPWHVGPTSAGEMSSWSQQARRSEHRAAAQELLDRGAAYVCECSRAEWSDYTGDDCPRRCERRGLALTPGSTALRFAEEGLRHVVLWRREDEPSYHLASVVDDDLFGVDFVVRGADLEESSGIQRSISRALPGSGFHLAEVVHHRLLTDDGGRKLSKSAGSNATPPERTPAFRDHVYSLTQRLLPAS